MSYLSARRMLSACVVSAAAVAALTTAGTASATTPTTDLTHQCAGSAIKGLGSTFQAPAQEVWNPDFNLSGNTNELACSGGQGSGGKPTVTYESTGTNSGSGACLKDFGDGGTAKYGTGATEKYSYCGTDEAPSAEALGKMEEGKAARGTESIESIPAVQGAVAVIVHLPAGCKAEDDVAKGAKTYKQSRLALDDSTVLGIYRGEIKNWKQVLANQGSSGSDTLSCTGGVTEEETPIKVVVRTDKSGTTHIFKSYLAQVEEAVSLSEWGAEEFNKIEEEGTPVENACGSTLAAGQLKTFKDVQEGCENQRWPEAADVVRPVGPGGKKGYKGNPGVVYEVAENPSSIGYADLSVARDEKYFSAKCSVVANEGKCGGENKKGSETKAPGEYNTRFWSEVQDNEPGETPLYAEPATNGDIEKAASSNCSGTDYIGKVGEPIPPKTTRLPWNTVKAALTEKKYAICGLTYDLALREYKPFLEFKKGSPLTTPESEEGEKQAQTTRDYLLWELSSKPDGGGKYIKNHDYAPLSGKVLKEAVLGAEEIGWAIG